LASKASPSVDELPEEDEEDEEDEPVEFRSCLRRVLFLFAESASLTDDLLKKEMTTKIKNKNPAVPPMIPHPTFKSTAVSSS